MQKLQLYFLNVFRCSASRKAHGGDLENSSHLPELGGEHCVRLRYCAALLSLYAAADFCMGSQRACHRILHDRRTLTDGLAELLIEI